MNEPTSESKNDETNYNENMKPSTLEANRPKLGVFQEEELLKFGTPARHHVIISLQVHCEC